MTNKKGSISRFILWFLFIFIFVFLIYSIYLGIKARKNKVDKADDSMRFVAPIDFNPLDYIYSYDIYAYKTNNFISNTSYNTTALNYESNTNIYFLSNTPNGVTFANVSSGYYPWGFDFYTNNSNALNLGRTLYDSRYYIENYYSSLGSSYSFMLAFNCDIPLNYFNFNFVYNLPLSSDKTISLYVLTDSGGYRFTNFVINNNNRTISFLGDSIASVIPGASKVIRFGFAVGQHTNSSNYTYYLPQYDSSDSNTSGFNYVPSSTYRNYFNSSSIKDSLILLNFSSSPYPSSYLDGYDSGYTDAIIYSNNQINSLNSQVNDLSSQISSLQVTINNQSQIIASLQAQLNESSNNFRDLFFTFADTPIKTVYNMLNFDFFGLNLFKFFTGVITALGAIWLIKKFI